jgi:hypothetical protein
MARMALGFHRGSCPHRHRIRTGLFEPKSPLRGNGIFRAETNRPKRPWRFKDAGERQNISPGNSANSGLIAGFREISVRTRMRGGPGRTRTSNQGVMSAVTAPKSSAIIGISARVCRRLFSFGYGVSLVIHWLGSPDRSRRRFPLRPPPSTPSLRP